MTTLNFADKFLCQEFYSLPAIPKDRGWILLFQLQLMGTSAISNLFSLPHKSFQPLSENHQQSGQVARLLLVIALKPLVVGYPAFSPDLMIGSYLFGCRWFNQAIQPHAKGNKTEITMEIMIEAKVLVSLRLKEGEAI